MAHIEKQEIENYLEGGELTAIPVVCDGEENARHPRHFINAEPDADSVWCSKCGKVVTFEPLF